MEELIRVLEKTVFSLQADQNEVVRYIQDYSERDFTGFLRALSDVLHNQQNPPVVRAAAGLQLKNQLTARDETVRHRQQEKWRNMPEQTRQYVKEKVFNSLGTEMFRPSSAPQCVAYIAIAELHEKEWPEFIRALVQNTKNPSSTVKLKLATLEAIGYVCQEIVSAEHQQSSRRRDITNGLNASMNDIYSYIGDCLNSQNYELMSTSLQCLSGLLSWAQINQELLRFLCQLLRNYDLKPGEAMDEYFEQKLAIYSSTCECLIVCLERKHSKPDSFIVRECLFEDDCNLRSIISTLDKLNSLPIQHDPQAVFETEKKLCVVLANIMRYVYICNQEKPQNLSDMYSIMKVIITHPSTSVSIEAVRFWNRVFAVVPKKPSPSISDDLTTNLLITCANKLIKAKYDSQLYGYEFDCQQDFDSFQSRYRHELGELCRNLTLQNDRVCFELVCCLVAKGLHQNNTNLNEWDALSILTAAVCAKLKDPNLYVMNGCEILRALMVSMDSTLQQTSSIPPDTNSAEASLVPDLISTQLSIVSGLCVFLPYWHQADKELTKDLLGKIVIYAFHRPDKFMRSSRELVRDNTSLLNNESFLRGFRALSRHASACFVRICLNHSKHLLDIFSHIKQAIDCLFSMAVDNPYSTEKCQLYEGLMLICNEEPDEVIRKKFALELFESIKWFRDYELNCDQFIDFVGFNRYEPELDNLQPQQMISQVIPVTQLNRVKMTYVINLLGAITRRLNSPATLMPEIFGFTKPILNLIFTMHAIWLPEMQQKCAEEYRNFLFAPFNGAYKQQILDTILVNQKPSEASASNDNPLGTSAFGDTAFRRARGSEQYIELFSWNFYEALLTTMGSIINKTSPDLFNYVNSVHLQTALTGAEYLPSLKMHKLIKHFIMPLVNNCSQDQNLIETQLLPLLSKLLPFLFEMLDRQWKLSTKEDDCNITSNIKIDQSQALADEMVQDQLLRNLSRDLIDLMNLILVESIPPPMTDTPCNNNASNNRSNNVQNSNRAAYELFKISKLGLNLLSAGPDFIMKVMASTLTWSDSTLNSKAIFINQQLVKHIIASNSIKNIEEASLWLGCMFGSVIASLRMFGEHEQNCSGLLALFLQLYENLNNAVPNFHGHLEQMTGVSKDAFVRFDRETMKANDKNKRAALRKILDSLVGNRVSLVTR